MVACVQVRQSAQRILEEGHLISIHDALGGGGGGGGGAVVEKD